MSISNIVCTCGHEKYDHADEVTGGKIVREAVEECTMRDCQCHAFKEKR
jgi:hypothetical protein